MSAGSLQHHVAVVLIRASSIGTTVRGSRCSRTNIKLATTRRWQTTTTKDVAVSGSSPHIPNRNEIPLDCYIDSSEYPLPSLQKVQPTRTVDLSTTRPAKIESPTAPQKRDYENGIVPVGDRAKYLFKLGKSYLVFYKTGLKNIWSNLKQYQALNKTFGGITLNNVAKYGGQTIQDRKVPLISRSEYQMCIRTRHDLFKMLPFSLVFIICGEFTPLVIVALGSAVVPYTCRIPQQTKKDAENKSKQDQNYMDDMPRLHPELESPSTTSDPDWRMEHLEAYRLGLTSIRTPLPLLGPIFHSLRTRPRLKRHCDNIVADSILVHREGGSFRLTHQDIYEWADAYGLFALQQYLKECRHTGRDPHTENLKTVLGPKIDAEIRYMLKETGDWSKLKPGEQWRVGLRTVGSKSPDWRARVDEMRKNWKQA